jgi:CHAD domain-containing protein
VSAHLEREVNVSADEVSELEPRLGTSQYYDTADRRLARAGITLKREVEDGKSVWQFELPRGDGREELEQAGGSMPPERYTRLLRGVLRGGELAVAAGVSDQDGRVEQLRALSVPDPQSLPAHAPPVAHLQAKLREQFDELLAHDPGVRLGGDPEDLHRLRVAVRRLRALLRAGRPLLDDEWVAQLRDELAWLGRELGPARDLDVFVDYLREEVATLPDLDRRRVAPVVEQAERDRKEAHRALRRTLGSSRYLSLLDDLDGATARPRTRDSEETLEQIAGREFRKLRKAMKRVGPTSPDEELHRARIKGKRARYAAELAEATAGPKVTGFVRRAKRFQDVIGEHQDAVVAEERLRELAKGRGAGAAFVLGRLVERQATRRERSLDDLPSAWKRLQRSGKRAFL